ncbi:MAG: sugar ABC transporter ATP-binding protein, partial [Clostridia bacterium]|nr:sugar ABC transporter ATP-binding protein [Clostridia bacterium]
ARNLVEDNLKILIMDEPTSSLSEQEVEALFKVMRDLLSKGTAIVYISHRLEEIMRIGDNVTIFRNGKRVAHEEVKDTSVPQIVRHMTGRDADYTRHDRHLDYEKLETILEVENLTLPKKGGGYLLKDVSFQLKKGEVLGIYGLMGAGRTELAMSIFGQSYGVNFSGTLKIDGKPVKLKKSESDAIKHRIAYVTEDRKGNGLILSQSIKVNTSLANLDSLARLGVIDQDREYAVAEEYRDKLKTKTPSVEQLVGNLSGGNQQKVLLAKWMFAEPDIMILDEPTRGIDVGAKYEIYCIINDLAAAGKSVIMISSELPEVLGMSDRIYIMNASKIVGEMPASEATQENIMAAILKSGRGA